MSKNDDAPIKGMHYFNLGPWPDYLGFTTSRKAFRAEMARLKIDCKYDFLASENAHATAHRFRRQGKMIYIICIEPFSNSGVSREVYAALLAHEAMHVIQFMQEDLSGGTSLGFEAEAYLIQQIVVECLQRAWTTNKRILREPR